MPGLFGLSGCAEAYAREVRTPFDKLRANGEGS
jgi:hypothetical protein